METDLALSTLFGRLGISLLLGLLVGLQREHALDPLAGMRTFPLITLLGSVCAMLSGRAGPWMIAAGLAGLAAVLTVANLAKLRQERPDLGTTTTVAALLMYVVGAVVVTGPTEVAVALGGSVAILLQFKPELHAFVRRLGDRDLRAIMQFVLITFIILPVLPARTIDPLGVVSPRETWLMVALIVGMSLGGYIVYKFLGRDAGILLGGFLGGAISSTATTVSQARLARTAPDGLRAAAIVIMIASTVVYGRILVEVAVVSRPFLLIAAPPIIILMLLTLIPALVLWRRTRGQPTGMTEQENPTQLRSAVVFAILYAGVLLALAAAQRYFGEQGLYVVAGLSGLTDMDAITLSTARMTLADREILQNGWRLLVIAALANLVFKAGLAGVLGGWRLLVRIAGLFAIPMAGGILLLLFWKPW